MSQPAIVLEGLSRRFGERLAVHRLSFQVEVGRFCGFLGRNGAGKTPTMHGWMKVRELVWFTAGFYDRRDREKVASLLERFGIDPEQSVKHLSRGTNAQLALALALGHNPERLPGRHHPVDSGGRPDGAVLKEAAHRRGPGGRLPRAALALWLTLSCRYPQPIRWRPRSGCRTDRLLRRSDRR